MNVRTTTRAAALIFLGSVSGASAESAGPIDRCDFHPAFMEEFHDLSVASRVLAGARWTAHTPWNGDFGDARFADPEPARPFALGEGELLITAAKDAAGKWRSGLIAAADSSGRGKGVRDGYFEARMKMPPGPGTWPAFSSRRLTPGRLSAESGRRAQWRPPCPPPP